MSKKREYQICTNCVMDTSDLNITFDENGECDHCHDFENNVKPNWHTDDIGKQELSKIQNQIEYSTAASVLRCH